MKTRPKILFIILLIAISTVSGLYVLEQQTTRQIEWKIDCGQEISDYQGVFFSLTNMPILQQNGTVRSKE